MVDETRDRINLPPLLMTSEPGSFARRTIVERKPQIIRQVIDDNAYPPDIVHALEAFAEEIASQPISPLGERSPDAATWNEALAAHHGKTWLEVPWYLAEAFFYRRLLETAHYFRLGPWKDHDPFEKQKRKQEQTAVQQLAQGWGGIASLAATEPDEAFEALLHLCLWGNRADLSNYTVSVQAQAGLAAREERHHILIDHTSRVQRLLANGLSRVDFVNDNVGIDLLFDLALTDFLLVQNRVQKAVFHLKDRPFFVSDAMPKDVRRVISLMCATSDEDVRALGARLDAHLEGERLVLKNNPFWTSHLTFRQMPPSLQKELSTSGLTILKGDVNYRRLLDDRHWPHTERMEAITAYFPSSFLALRTLKGEIMVGLEPGQAAALAAKDPTWMINGKRGIIQLVVRSA
jgi:hypothetical protein